MNRLIVFGTKNHMPTTQRQQAILRTIQNAGSVRVRDMAVELDVSLETIRRDVKPLADAGLIRKAHGSLHAVIDPMEAPFERRMREHATEKERIANHVASLIEDGDSVMLDTGTTTSYLARALRYKTELTVVTNSSDVARTLATVNGNRVYMAGGELDGDNGAAFGRSAIEFVSSFSVSHAVVTIGAIDDDAGFMDHHLAEAEFARQVLQCGRNRIVVTDSSKFSRTALVRVCGYEDIDLLVCDAPPSLKCQENIVAAGAEIDVAS